MKKLLLSFLCIACSLFILAASNNHNSIDITKLTTGERPLKVGHIIFPPLYIQGNVGMDADIINAVAKKAGINKVEFVNFNTMPEMLNAFETGKVDIIASGILSTPERAKKYLLSTPYFQNGGVAFLYLKENQNFQNVKDAKGHQIGILKGSYPADWLEQKGVPSSSVKSYDTFAQLIDALKQKKIDLVVTNYKVAIYQQKINQEPMEVTLLELKPVVYLLRKQDTDLQQKLNVAITQLTADKTITNMHNKYMPATNREP